MKKIVIDAGHGGFDPGVVANGVKEKDVNLPAAFILEEELVRNGGYSVMLTRRSDVALGDTIEQDLENRCRIANDWGADLFISLHADSAGNPDAKGHHVIYSIHDDGKLANLLSQNIPGPVFKQPWTRTLDDDPHSDYYAVIRETKMTAVIIERGFLTNGEESKTLQSEDYTRAQMRGIVKALNTFYGIKPATPPADEITEIVRKLQQKNLVASPDYWEKVLRGEMSVNVNFLKTLLKRVAG